MFKEFAHNFCSVTKKNQKKGQILTLHSIWRIPALVVNSEVISNVLEIKHKRRPCYWSRIDSTRRNLFRTNKIERKDVWYLQVPEYLENKS